MTDKISIVIPAYNIAKALGPCLDSILAQTYTNIEVIIVNDGSKDETPSVMDRYAALDSRVKAIHKENGGVTSARLQGVKEASGQWIGFVDGDDQIDSDMYERLLKNALTYDADISHCGYQMIFPSRVDLYYGTGKLVEQSTESGLADLLRADFVEPALCNKLYRKELFTTLFTETPMDPNIRNYEDLLMNFYLFRKSKKSIYEDFCPYHYLLRAGSAATSRLNEHKAIDPIRVSKIIMEKCRDNITLYPLTQVRLVRQLIKLSTTALKDYKSWLKPHRSAARKELRQILPALKGNPAYSRSLRLQGYWAAYSPGSYQAVHRLHSKITGNDKKYEVK